MLGRGNGGERDLSQSGAGEEHAEVRPQQGLEPVAPVTRLLGRQLDFAEHAVQDQNVQLVQVGDVDVEGRGPVSRAAATLRRLRPAIPLGTTARGRRDDRSWLRGLLAGRVRRLTMRRDSGEIM